MSHSSFKYKTIIGLNQQHQHIASLFNRHQKMIMHGKMNQAIDILEEHNIYVKNHMKAENDFLLPLYEKYISPVPIGGAVEFFRNEHHKIIRFMSEFSKALSERTDKSKIKKIELVNLFDEHYKFKDLLSHHHAREDTYLFRLLDKVLKDKIKKEVLKHFVFDDQ
jgi:hemerythrin-like domain-containing protein